MPNGIDININGYTVENVHLFFSKDSNEKGSYFSARVNVKLMCGNVELASTDLGKEDMSPSTIEFIRNFRDKLEDHLLYDLKRKSKQLPPHLDDTIEDAEVSDDS